MVGGAAQAKDELLFSFVFPERPGALLKFLSVIAARWNISLFHYRNHGADDGKVLVGFQVAKAERKEFEGALAEIGYSYIDVTNDPVCKNFLRR